MIKQISKEGGTGTKTDSILGGVFNYADKSNALIENIMTLTKGDDGKLSPAMRTHRVLHYCCHSSSLTCAVSVSKISRLVYTTSECSR